MYMMFNKEFGNFALVVKTMKNVNLLFLKKSLI